jgi:hypothetical protein
MAVVGVSGRHFEAILFHPSPCLRVTLRSLRWKSIRNKLTAETTEFAEAIVPALPDEPD